MQYEFAIAFDILEHVRPPVEIASLNLAAVIKRMFSRLIARKNKVS